MTAIASTSKRRNRVAANRNNTAGRSAILTAHAAERRVMTMSIFDSPTARLAHLSHVTSIDLTFAGRRFGYLDVAYGRRHDIACRCRCSRLVHVAAEALASGTVTSCGCQPAPRAFWIQYHELQEQRRREIEFSIAKAR
jgi:hypothetical protein